MAVTPEHNPAVQWLGEQRGAMLALLEELVNIDSGSYDKAGVDAVGVGLQSFFGDHGMPVTWHRIEDFGDAFTVQVGAPEPPSKTILLMGHRDTVFPKGEVARRPFKIVGSRAYGPGVADMKAGLVMNAFVLAAYHRFGGAPGPLVGLFTGDEEIASGAASRAVITQTARGARAVFNAEPGRPSGNVVTGRKGGVFMRMEVFGKAAHSGGNFQAGINANGELAHKIVALHDITDLPRGMTVNVGLVAGGQSVNTTSPYAEAQIDLRYVTPADRAEAMQRIETIAANTTVPGASSRLEIRGEFNAFVQDEGSKALFEIYKSALQDIGMTVQGEFSGGCADSGLTASLGCPTLCGVGPVGGMFHSPEEYMEIETLVPRAQGLALAIARLEKVVPDSRSVYPN
ncbi:M20 family metallopeptidase [Cupriavidus sp. CuC1]|uniref:M20 family metallopeptidase n=1 Tax=Cupriavidus sp. CuC1 TaxID=3373131 RepID=UPI0037D36BC8